MLKINFKNNNNYYQRKKCHSNALLREIQNKFQFCNSIFFVIELFFYVMSSREKYFFIMKFEMLFAFILETILLAFHYLICFAV